MALPRILVVRPRRTKEAVDDLSSALIAGGGEVVVFSPLAIASPDNWAALDEALTGLANFDWVLFTSQNGVAGFLDRLRVLGLVWPASPRAAAVGDRTRAALHRLSPREIFVSPLASAVGLGEALAPFAQDRRFLWPTAQVAPRALAKVLHEAGAAEVRVVAAYQARAEADETAGILAQLARGEIDAVVVTSARVAEAAAAALGPEGLRWLAQLPHFGLGESTARACRALGFGPFAIASEASHASLARAVRGFLEARRRGAGG